jgi:release factor glutamine methyltransferase
MIVAIQSGSPVPPDRPPPLPEAAAADAAYLLRPSEYTAALLRTIEQQSGTRPLGRAIDIGVGSGVLLTALAARGAAELWGTDIDPYALRMARHVVEQAASGRPVTIRYGDIWNGMPDVTFDTVVANLPMFPAEHVPSSGRLPAWSGGGLRNFDRFIDGLPHRLAKGGVAWVAHYALLGLGRTRARLAGLGLSCELVSAWTVYEPEERVRALSYDQVHDTGSLRRYGGYHFVDAQILEIRA